MEEKHLFVARAMGCRINGSGLISVPEYVEECLALPALLSCFVNSEKEGGIIRKRLIKIHPQKRMRFIT